MIHTTFYVIVDEMDIDSETVIDSEEEPNSVSKHEGFVNIAGWLCFKSPKLSKLGKRKHEITLEEEPEFALSQWIDLQNRGYCNLRGI